MGKRTTNGLRLLALAFAATACAGQVTSTSDTTAAGSDAGGATTESTAPAILADQSDAGQSDSAGSGGLGSSASPGTGSNGSSADDDGTPSSGSTGISNESNSEDAGSSTVPDEGEEVNVFALEVGDCFNSLELDEVTEVDGLSCDKSHLYEVYYAFDIVADEFPGDAAVAEEAADGCLATFEGFVGLAYEDSFLDISYLYPTTESWNRGGDREVLCLVLNLDETPRTGTALGSEI